MNKLAALVVAFLALPVACFAANPPPGYAPLEELTPAPVVAAQSRFEAHRGDSLRATLDRWASSAGWQSPVVWKLPEDTDFTLGADGKFDPDFVTSTKTLINALGSEAKLRVRLNHGNRVLVVEPMQ